MALDHCFFFSSRRRHTRCSRDWSSDVCSSDLVAVPGAVVVAGFAAALVAGVGVCAAGGVVVAATWLAAGIGRASGKGKSVDLGGRRIIKKKKKRNEGECGTDR